MASTLSHLFHWCKSFGRPTGARLSRWRAATRRIISRCQQLTELSDAELGRRGIEIRWRTKTGTPLQELLEESYALVREAARRTLGMQHYPVQVMGGMALFEGHVAEMQTGEGKTLTAALPVFLRALPGRGCHVVTVNDYLAQRDSELIGPIYQMLGLTVGCIQSEMSTDERREVYSRDITYGTAKELGFDFLRDRLRMGASPRRLSQRRNGGSLFSQGEQPVQRGHDFALIDEADSILIDEARTPLIIGLTQPNDAPTVGLMRWSDRATRQLQSSTDYIYEPDRRTAYLTDAGCRKVLLMAKPSLLQTIGTSDFYTHVERALTARLAFQRDRDYVVVEEEVIIVDESTGRMMQGRKWQDGLHQAVEAKEMLPITAETGQAARVTVQRYFRQYAHLAGMTGTAVLARRELKKAFQLKVTPIPTHRKCIRQGLPPRIFKTLEDKWATIAEEIVSLHSSGRAVLVGTPSVNASEILDDRLTKLGVPHQVLNARFHKQEAEIVSQAGQPGKVTIATNMAGRGTDIILHEDVTLRGGLHVIATEIHSSARIDRQLIGRAARQGDPGSFQFFLSLEDELLRCRSRQQLEQLQSQARQGTGGELPRRWLSAFRSAQAFLERTHAKQRKQLLRSEQRQMETYRQMGLDPYLELAE